MYGAGGGLTIGDRPGPFPSRRIATPKTLTPALSRGRGPSRGSSGQNEPDREGSADAKAGRRRQGRCRPAREAEDRRTGAGQTESLRAFRGWALMTLRAGLALIVIGSL